MVLVACAWDLPLPFFPLTFSFRLLLAFLACALSSPLLVVKRPVADEYVLAVRAGADPARLSGARLNATLLSAVLSIGSYRFLHVHAKNTTTLLAHPDVLYAEQNGWMFSSGAGTTCYTQDGAPWGIDRIDHVLPSLSGAFDYSSDGSGVTVYVVDTGINIAHEQFQGRASWGTNTVDNDNTDGNGHGTHVAGTIGGSTFGVAKRCSLVAVKVLSASGSGTNAGVLKGISWAVAAHKKRGPGARSVLNLSLGGGFSQSINDGSDAAVKAGTVMVVAAGNEDSDACDSSPASAREVVSVGATLLEALSNAERDPNEKDEQRDARSYFSNYGPCVHLFAPGSMIPSAWIGSSTALKTISGTSMASPHAAGAAAVMWSDKPSLSNSEIRALLLSSAVPDAIDLQCDGDAVCSQSPNKLLHLASCSDPSH